MIVQDRNATELDKEAAVYRRAVNRGYSLSAQGRDVEAQRILDRANVRWAEAQRKYPLTRIA